MTTRQWKYHDEAERRHWQDPEAILSDIGVQPGATFMDIGCGQGFFTLPAARIVGPQGSVYAVDTSADALGRLGEKARQEDVNNLILHAGRAEDTVLCQACADIVFFGIVLHDFADPVRVLMNARQMLKPGGKLVNVDWKKREMSVGPPVSKRFSEEQATALIESAGLKVTAVRDSGVYHYLIVATP